MKRPIGHTEKVLDAHGEARRKLLAAVAALPAATLPTAPTYAADPPATKTSAHVRVECGEPAASSARWRAVIAGKEPALAFDGYTSCPLVVRIGAAMLIEFDYDGRLTPTLPGVEPLQESWFAWLMKTRLLKPAYVAVLKGRA